MKLRVVLVRRLTAEGGRHERRRQRHHCRARALRIGDQLDVGLVAEVEPSIRTAVIFHEASAMVGPLLMRG